MMIAVQMLSKKIKNKNVTWIEPNGGYTLWLTFNNTELDYPTLNKILHSHKIRLAVGSDFFPYPTKKKHFRMAIASVNEDEIIAGVNRLAQAVKEIYNYKSD